MKNLGAVSIRPFVAAVLVPLFILAFSASKFSKPDEISFYLGLGFLSAGASILTATLRLYIKKCELGADQSGAPRDLITSGMYAYVRNPAEIGLAAMLVGESVFFGSALILLWFFCYFAIRNAHIIYVEEPGLAKRYECKYFDYARNVGRWIPRKRPWKSDSD